MPRSGSTSSASPTLNCYACNGQFPRSDFPAEFNEDGLECCPECGSEFVELFDQAASNEHPAEGAGATAAEQPSSSQPQNERLRGSTSGGAREARRGVGAGLGSGSRGGARIEVRAVFGPSPNGSGGGGVEAAADMPLTFVDAISRFAPLNLPNGQQAFVLQVQDGALLSPFTMGLPFGDAIALNPADWVVGDDLDAVVSRLLDAYMPPRRATPSELRDALPRLQVRPGPLSPQPTAALKRAAAAAAAAAAGGEPELAAAREGGGDGEPEQQRRPAREAAVSEQQKGEQQQHSDTEKEGGDLEVRLEAFEQLDGGDGGGGVRLRLRCSGRDVARGGAATADGGGGGGGKDAPSASSAGAGSAAAAAADGFASCQPGELCTVCHDAFEAGGEVVELPCRHCFHEDCILPWLQERNTCPVCRTRLGEGNGGGGGGWSGSGQRQPRPQPRPQQQDDASTSDDADAAGGGTLGGSAAATTQGRASGGGDGVAAVASAASRPQIPPPRQPLLPSQQRRRAGTGRAATAHFPLLGALRHQQQHPPTGLATATAAGRESSALSPEDRQAAEAALAPLRIRFAPLRLAISVAPPPSAAVTTAASLPLFGGSVLLPVFGASGDGSGGSGWAPEAILMQGHQVRAAGGGGFSQPQPPSGPGQPSTATTALRGGFLNNPLLNLYGNVPSASASSRTPGGSSGGVAGGTRSALRGGFFNSGSGDAGTLQRPRRGGSAATAAAGLGSVSGLRPQRPSPRQPPTRSGNNSSNINTSGGGGGGGAVSGTAAPREMPPGLRPDMLPRMIWSVALGKSSQQSGMLAVPNPPAGGSGGAATGAAGAAAAVAARASDRTSSAAAPSPSPSTASPSPSPSPSSAAASTAADPASAEGTACAEGTAASPFPAAPAGTCTATMAAAGTAAGTAAASAAAAAAHRDGAEGRHRSAAAGGFFSTAAATPAATGLPLGSASLLSDPDLGGETALLQLARVVARADRSGRPRPTQAQLRELRRQALGAAERMLASMPFASPGPGLMEAVEQVSNRWLARATRLLQRPQRTAAAVTTTTPASVAATRAADAAAASNSSRGGGNFGEGQGRDREESEEAAGDEGPSRQVVRHSRREDAASLAHQQQQYPSAGGNNDSVAADGAAAAAAAQPSQLGSSRGDGGGAADGAAAGDTAEVRAAALSGARGPRVTAVRKGRVLTVVRGSGGAGAGGRASTSTPPTAAAAAPAARRRSASLPRAGEPVSSRGSTGGGDGVAEAAVYGGGRRRSGADGGAGDRGGGGGRFNPLAAVAGGAGAGLRLLGAVAGGLLRLGRGNGGNGGNGGGSSNSNNRAEGAARGRSATGVTASAGRDQ